MPRPTKNSSTTPVVGGNCRQTGKCNLEPQSDELAGSSSEQEFDVNSLSEEGKLLFSLLSRKLDTFLGEIRLKTERLERCEDENRELRAHLVRLEDRLDSLETRSRRKNLVLSGNVLQGISNENLTQDTIDLLRTHLNCEIFPQNILSLYRIGSRNTPQSSDSRSIMIKLRDQEIKGDILSS